LFVSRRHLPRLLEPVCFSTRTLFSSTRDFTALVKFPPLRLDAFSTSLRGTHSPGWERDFSSRNLITLSSALLVFPLAWPTLGFFPFCSFPVPWSSTVTFHLRSWESIPGFPSSIVTSQRLL